MIVAFWHRPDAPPPERVVATTIVLERAPPTPRPTPARTPTPAPPLVHATVAPVPQRAAPRAERPAGGSSLARPLAPHPVAPHLAVAAAPGVGTGAGSGPSAGDDAGPGSGSGGMGSGTIDAGAPCGYVEFVPDEGPKVVGTTSYETISATVHYPDGHTASEVFPYPWIYTDWMDTDPWSPVNVRKTNLVVFAQLPPPGSDVHRYPEIVRYILDHTNPNGSTVLQPCPR